MHSALKQFEDNISRVRALGELASGVSGLTTAIVDVTDILRAQIVMMISALDHLVHELVRLGMIEVAKGKRPRTDAYKRFAIRLSYLDLALSGSMPDQWLDNAIRENHGWLSFQDPKKIAKALRLISDVQLWNQIGIRLSMDPHDVKAELLAIIDRRNKIAHEADIDPTNPSFCWPIDSAMVDRSIKFVETIGHAIFHSVL